MFFLLEEATEHFRKAFPDLVRVNEEPILTSFARMARIFVKQRGIGPDVHVFSYSEDQNKTPKKTF